MTTVPQTPNRPSGTRPDKSLPVSLTQRGDCKNRLGVLAGRDASLGSTEAHVAGRTSPARRAHRSTPAATAAVSARRTVGPSPTRGYPRAGSEGSQPPSGPTARAGSAGSGGSPPGWARARGTGARLVANSSRSAASSTSGSQARRLWAAASPRHPPQPGQRPVAAVPRPPHHGPFRRHGHDPVHPGLGQLLHDPLRPAALHGDEGHGELGWVTLLAVHGPVGLERSGPGTGAGPGDETEAPRPAPVAGHHGLPRPEPQDVLEVVGVVGGHRQHVEVGDEDLGGGGHAGGAHVAGPISRRRSAGAPSVPRRGAPHRGRSQRPAGAARPPGAW